MKRFIETMFAGHELYYNNLTSVCNVFNVSHTELIILLCLDDYPEYDTATDIVELRKLTKSAVSVAVRALQEKGFIMGEYANGNYRSIHLKICDSAIPVIEAGKRAQEKFFGIIYDGLADEDKERMKYCFEHIADNIKKYNSRY